MDDEILTKNQIRALEKRLPDMSKPTYFYCDESHHIRNDGVDFMALGAIYLKSYNAAVIENNIIEIKKANGFTSDYEIKWTKINPKNINLAKALILYVANCPQIRIRTMFICDKNKYTLNMSSRRYDKWYYTMYYHLIKKPCEYNEYMANSVTLHVDKKNTLMDKRMTKLCKRLSSNLKPSFNFTICDSVETQFIQIIDILLGALCYEKKEKFNSKAKTELLHFIQGVYKRNKLIASTLIRSLKWNHFNLGGDYDGNKL
ncbi:MAG: DUF3800 domain-containing protein [Erysipelotrichales bacterium]|nr:DUF3800 domain-containing protein [Erysipelotrichales bacterium]